MSIDQPELSEFDRAPHERRLEDAGAAYAPNEIGADAAPKQAPENVCLNCGTNVSPQVARVLGDNNGCIPACAEPECRKDAIVEHSKTVKSYSVTARVVRAVRSAESGKSTIEDGGERR